MFGYANYNTGTKSKCKFRKVNKESDWKTVEKILVNYFAEMAKCIATDKA
jgi:hypothetical protein